jgi:membrane protein YdbS with pleckstrin-like domain
MDFTNNTVNLNELPKFEDATLTKIHPSYLKIVMFNIALFYGIFAIAAGLAFYYFPEIRPYWLLVSLVYAFLVIVSITVSYISFKNKSFAFRTHDVIYRTGAIAITTTIIPYNRVQHAAIHEGFLSRRFGLAKVEIFTAGGVSSDIKIPGLEKGLAEKVRHLVMGKIDNSKEEEEKNAGQPEEQL